MRRRLTLGLFLALELILGSLICREVRDLEAHYRTSTEALLMDSAHLVAALLAADIQDGIMHTDRVRLAVPNLRRQPVVNPSISGSETNAELHISVTDRTGRVIYDSHGQTTGYDRSAPMEPRTTAEGHYAAQLDRNPATNDLATMFYVAAPILWQERQVGEVKIGKPVLGFQLRLGAARQHFLLGSLFSGLALLILAIAVTVWWLRPLDLVTDYLRLLRRRQFQDLPNLGRSALGWLGAVLDEMRDALAGRRYVEDYVQALTHEIKSPLATIRAGAELMENRMPVLQRRRFLCDIQDAVGHIQAIVDRLLDLAALEQRRALAVRQPMTLAEVTAEALEALVPDAKARQVRVVSTVPAGPRVAGQRSLLVCALINLLQNAIEFSPAAGRVDIALTEAGEYHELTVQDQGPGIPAYARPRLFERFYSLPRPGTRKRSTGLGLSFVREIAELHQGRIDLQNHPAGGAIARLRLPKA